MNGTKRSHSAKSKDMPTSSRHKSEGKYVDHQENNLANIPIIKQSDNASQLPMYTAVLGKSSSDGVSMEDLDQLQQDLEKLLSASAVRVRYLLGEIESLDRVEENRDKKEKPHEKTSLKRKRPDEKSKYKDSKNGSRLINKKQYLPVNNFVGDARNDIPKVTLPKNDNSDKFWSSIEPFCTNVNKDDVAFIDNLIQEFTKEIDIKIPEVGDHYAHEWSEEIINEEQSLGRSPKSKTGPNIDIKKNGISAMVDTFSSPHTQRLLAALIEERVLTSFPTVTEKLKASDLNSKSAGPRVGICMDKRLQKELVEQGILSIDDLPKNLPEDEILAEIKKCQQELATVNEYNLEELNKLRTVVMKDLQKQEIKAQLDKVDNQVLDLYNKILVAKKQAQQAEEDCGEDCDKEVLARIIAKEFKGQADAILKQQVVLHKELSGLSAGSTLC